MRTMQWKFERVAVGKYHVRLKAIGDSEGNLIPGLIIGGPCKWVVQVGGNQWPQSYKTRNDAADAMVRAKFDL